MRSLALAAIAMLATGCVGLFQGDVERKIHGRVYTGPFISEEAYAAYLEGSIAEQQRDWPHAEQAYLRASSLDPKTPDPWVRIGAVRCTRGAYAEAAQAFSEAARHEAGFAPLLREQARCAFAQGNTPQARSFALQAVALDPYDPVPPLLLARMALETSDFKEARRWLTSLSMRDPRSPELQAFLQEHPHPSLAGFTQRVPPSASPTGAKLSLAQMDRALPGATPEEARSMARKAGITQGELASRAAALGLTTLAQEQGRLILEADPGNTDARIALLEASDLRSESGSLAVRLPLASITPPSPVGVLLLARLLLRKSGPESARAVLRHASSVGEDALASRLRDALKTRLEGL